MKKLELANEFVEKNKDDVILTYRNKYHLSAPIGWLNDPNGFVYYKGEYHLFYQYNPYDSVWGPMYWGHAKTKDLTTWVDLPIALAPDREYDKGGCFSGSAIVKDGMLYLIYTGHTETDGKRREVQCIASSSDGIHFEKYEHNPVIDETDIKNYGTIEDFRDPKIFEREGNYYSVVASKTEEERGEILLFKSKNILDWEFVSVLLTGTKEQGVMWECPDLFEVDEKDVLIFSPIQMKQQGFEFANISSTLSVIGKMDWDAGVFNVEHAREIDFGMDFYAPQTCLDDKNNRIMVAWMQMWGRTMPTNVVKHKWAGSMTLPRELSVKNNQLIQKPPSFIRERQKKVKIIKDIVIQDEYVFKEVCKDTSCFVIDLDLTEGAFFEIEFAKSESGALALSYDKASNMFSFDRGTCGYEIVGDEKTILTKRSAEVKPVDNILHIEIFRDVSSIELFINKEITMSNTFFEKEKGRDMVIHAKGKIILKSLEITEVITDTP